MKVNYFKKHDRNGTSYDQTITIPFDMAWSFNKYIDDLKEETKDKFFERLKYRNTCFVITGNKEK